MGTCLADYKNASHKERLCVISFVYQNRRTSIAKTSFLEPPDYTDFHEKKNNIDLVLVYL
ncbi:hypothetical protein C5S36_01440 [Candidatus Methanophagaceae archaeon]|nr:hypothetical protein C5S36_01440 [Methanophagales archaeon]